MLRLLILLISINLLLCSESNNLGGSISDVDLELALFYGYVVNENGEGVSDVEVIVFNPDSQLSLNGDFGEAIDTFYTQSNGYYQFDSLDYGTYTIMANYNDSLFADNMNILHDSVTFAGIDTLRPPGTITGTVSLDGNNNMGVLIYVPGTSYLSVSDSLGRYNLSGIPADSSYTIVFQYYGYAIVQLSGITVTSGDTTELSPVILSKNQYPIGLNAQIDSSTNIVTISWNKMHNDDIKGYVVYRKDSSLTALFPEQLNSINLVTDTFYIDTLNEELFSQSDTIIFQYQVKAKNLKEDLSPFSDKVFIKAYSISDSTTQKTISIILPNLEDTINGSETYKLLWNFTGLIDSVQLSFTPNDGASWFTICNTLFNKGHYYWNTPNIESSKCRYRVMDISDSIYYDESDLFTIKAIDNSNILKNGDFSFGIANWVKTEFNNAHANLSVVDGVCKINIDSIGTESWHISLAQRSIPLMQGYVYKVKFDAKAEKSKDIRVGIIMAHDPWLTYSEFSKTITTELKTYTGELFMSHEDDFNSDFVFALGDDNTNIEIDNISLEIVK